MGRELSADVGIVGGGLMGASTALFLRQRGVSVVLLERGLIGQQASGVNYGNVRRQGRAMRQLPLANRSREIWGRLPQLTGADVEFLPVGHLRVVYTKAQVDSIEAYAQEAMNHGLELELFDRHSLLRRYPFFGPEVLGGSLAPQDGHANPRLTAPAIGRAARALGATVLENCEVVDIDRDAFDFRIATRSGIEVRAPVGREPALHPRAVARAAPPHAGVRRPARDPHLDRHRRLSARRRPCDGRELEGQRPVLCLRLQRPGFPARARRRRRDGGTDRHRPHEHADRSVQHPAIRRCARRSRGCA